MLIKVTDNAFKRVGELAIKADNPDGSALRISVDGGGCSGFMYNYELISKTKIEPADKIIKKDEVVIVIDPVSQKFMESCEIDFVEELGSSYFQVRNPNAKAKCGCGNSFSIAN